MYFQTEEGRLYAADEQGRLLAEVTFPFVKDGVVEINRTFVDGSLRGQGVAGRMMESVAVLLRERGWKAVPTCSYALKWFGDHPEFGDVLTRQA